jgi:hypothetical protein
MNKWYMKLFQRLLNSTAKFSEIVCWENKGMRIEHVSYQVQLVDGLFVKCGTVVEHKVPSQLSSDNTVP